MPAPTDAPIQWASDATWTSGSRTGEDTKITPPAGVAEQGLVGDMPVDAEYVNATLDNFWRWLEFFRGEAGRDQFGDGSDGDVTIGAGTTTLTRDMYYSNLTISAARFLRTAGYRVFVRNTLTIAATGGIHNDGTAGANGNGAVSVGGAGAPAGSLLGGADGGNGPALNNGADGTNDSADSLGGAGGAGGDSNDGGNGGAGGTVTAPVAARGGYRHLHAALGYLHGNAYTQFSGGAGGGAGGGGTAGDGGAGGGGAGPLVVWARVIANAGFIRSHGGNGGNGYTGPDAAGNGGGGGGGGGPLYVVCRQYTGAGTTTSAGGTGGAGFGIGDDGINGDASPVAIRMVA